LQTHVTSLPYLPLSGPPSLLLLLLLLLLLAITTTMAMVLKTPDEGNDDLDNGNIKEGGGERI